MIIAVLVSVLIFTGIIMLTMRVDRSNTLSERVRRLKPEEEDAPRTVNDLTSSDEPSPLVQKIEGILNTLGIPVKQYITDHQPMFQRAGLTSPSAPIVYLFFKYIASGFFVLIGIAIALMPAGSGLERILHLLVAAIFAGGGVLGPDMYIRNITQKRQDTLQRSFPDALDLLLVCVESGLALDGAFARVTRELGRAHPDITAELNRTRMELTLLNNRSQALQNLADRTGLLAFRSLVATLMQSEKFGTNLSETLRILAEDYRNERLMIAENKAGRLPTLMTIPLICFMMPAFFLIILGPAILGIIAATRH